MPPTPSNWQAYVRGCASIAAVCVGIVVAIPVLVGLVFVRACSSDRSSAPVAKGAASSAPAPPTAASMVPPGHGWTPEAVPKGAWSGGFAVGEGSTFTSVIDTLAAGPQFVLVKSSNFEPGWATTLPADMHRPRAARVDQGFLLVETNRVLLVSASTGNWISDLPVADGIETDRPICYGRTSLVAHLKTGNYVRVDTIRGQWSREGRWPAECPGDGVAHTPCTSQQSSALCKEPRTVFPDGYRSRAEVEWERSAWGIAEHPSRPPVQYRPGTVVRVGTLDVRSGLDLLDAERGVVVAGFPDTIVAQDDQGRERWRRSNVPKAENLAVRGGYVFVGENRRLRVFDVEKGHLAFQIGQ